jgi:hypothetical protein
LAFGLPVARTALKEHKGPHVDVTDGQVKGEFLAGVHGLAKKVFFGGAQLEGDVQRYHDGAVEGELAFGAAEGFAEV